MKEPITFSIVTAVFNAAGVINRTIESIRKQTYRGFDWIVVDGASKDDTLLRVKGAVGLSCQLVSEPDKGIADGWNKGIRLAKGSYVLILNAGDTYDPIFLEMLAKYCDGTRVVCSHARRVSEQGKDAGVFLAQPWKLDRAMHVPHNWCAVPRHIYEEMGLYRNLALAMDFDWFHRYYKKFGIDGFVVVDAPLGTYFLGGTSDRNYIRSFAANERILVEHGGSRVRAGLYRYYYTMKHLMVRRVFH